MTSYQAQRRRHATAAAVGLVLALGLLPSGAPAATVLPRASTGGVSHVKGTTGQLNGVVDPNGIETSYYFQYGPTIAYGAQSKPVPVGAGVKQVKVGQIVTGLLPGYHYRIAATYAGGAVPVFGKDKSFSGGKSTKLKFVVPHGKEEQLTVAYGGSIALTGSLTGLGNANHGLTLQATPFPYTAAFTTLGTPILSSRTGSFSFRLSKLTGSTELRVLTTDARPLYSQTVLIHVTPKIVLHIRPAGKPGRYRLYGTVVPAKAGAFVTFQQLLPQKANSKRSGPRPRAVGSVKLKRAGASESRFSTVLTLTGTFRYRAFVKLPKGSLDSGHSNNVLVHAPAAAVKGHKKHKKKHK
jgi:hypothetical protein